MDKDIKSVVEEVKKESAMPTVSAVLSDGSLVEMLHRPEEHRTVFCVFKDGQWRLEDHLLEGGQRLVPYSPNNNLLRHEVVLLPSEPAEYESEEELLAAIRAFIHRYVDVSPLFETIASYYVLFTWVFDDFNELPYLRVRGDFGSGKTRFLLTVGSLCYKPIFASGASTVSPLFRILDGFGGTLIVDEGDFRFSDEKAEVVKILNNGNARGFPVLRSESVRGREFDPRAYNVFGPKLVGTRGFFQDRALESRCLTEQMGTRELRPGIPLSFTAEARREALAIRNQLLLFRFRRKGNHQAPADLAGHGIEPRLAQILSPLLSVVSDEESRQEIRDLALEYNRDLVVERGMDLEGLVLEAIRTIRENAPQEGLSIKAIADLMADRHGDDFDRKLTPHWIGQIVRRKLGLKTEKRHGSYYVATSEMPKLPLLFERYGIQGEPEDSRDTGDSQRGPQTGEDFAQAGQ
jgi:hypothetical protein